MPKRGVIPVDKSFFEVIEVSCCESWDLLELQYPEGTVTDYAGVEDGWERVIRGSAWGNQARTMRSAKRYRRAYLAPDRYLGARFLRIAP